MISICYAKKVHEKSQAQDFEERFQLEDEGVIFADEAFKWSYLKEVQLSGVLRYVLPRT